MFTNYPTYLIQQCSHHRPPELNRANPELGIGASCFVGAPDASNQFSCYIKQCPIDYFHYTQERYILACWYRHNDEIRKWGDEHWIKSLSGRAEEKSIYRYRQNQAGKLGRCGMGEGNDNNVYAKKALLLHTCVVAWFLVGWRRLVVFKSWWRIVRSCSPRRCR